MTEAPEKVAYEFVLDVPDTDILLNANDRRHWAVRSRHTRYWRELASFTVQSKIRREGWPRLDRARITVTMQWRTRHRRDAANWAPTAKAAIDGIVDAGLLRDDSNKYVIGPDMRGEVDPALTRPRIVVTIEPLPPVDW